MERADKYIFHDRFLAGEKPNALAKAAGVTRIRMGQILASAARLKVAGREHDLRMICGLRPLRYEERNYA